MSTSTTAQDAATPAPPGGAPRVAVIIPCYNEAVAIDRTVADFRAALPHAEIYVYDNNSTDDTVAVARAAGATVRSEKLQGKGSVVRRMFADVDADVYVMVDGDATYEAAAAPAMIERMVREQLDMVVGARATETQAAYRRGHRFGNWLLTACVARLFGRTFTDILSGYRVFSRRFAKSFPMLAADFGVETEITIHALELKMPVGEVLTAYSARPEGSTSKLSTYKDGLRILALILGLFRQERPAQLYGLLAVALGLLSVLIAIPLLVTYLQTGLVPRIPTAILCTGLGLLGVLSGMCGLILDTVTRGRREMKRLAYLALPAVRD
jgi:glycosyltransferase involved in cell wall biosynthesis